MVSRKVTVAVVALFSLSQVIVYLTIDFFKFVAGIALKLRPELLTLTLWEAVWSKHFTDWLWLLYPGYALLLNVVLFGGVSIIFGCQLGRLWEVL